MGWWWCMEEHFSWYGTLRIRFILSGKFTQPSLSTQSVVPQTQSPRLRASSSVISSDHSHLNSPQPQQSFKVNSTKVANSSVRSTRSPPNSQDLFSALAQSTSAPPLLPKPLSPPSSEVQFQKLNQPTKPNYNISLEPRSPSYMGSLVPSQPSMLQPLQPSPPSLQSLSLAQTSQTSSMGGILTPSRPMQSPWSVAKKPSQNDWEGFDPLA